MYGQHFGPSGEPLQRSEIMWTFIRKRGLTTEEQDEETFIHLKGKAREAVKVGVKSLSVWEILSLTWKLHLLL